MSLKTLYSQPSNPMQSGLSTGLPGFCVKKSTVKKKPPKKKGSRQGKIPEDWAGQGIQIPKKMCREFRELSGAFGHGGVKVLGTAAIAILLALDDEDRQTICQYVFQKTHQGADHLDQRRVLELLKMLLHPNTEGGPPVEPQWFVDKIVDPEVSSQPGKKPSDRTQGGPNVEKRKSG